MANGILIVDKPRDWTSHDVVAKLRSLLHERRIGHGGTLDPLATGVLPVFVGRATRAVEFFESAEKEYIAGLRLGLATNTEDTTGEVLETRPVTCSRAEVEETLRRFVGVQTQLPPMFSAVKIGGKKLYELARKGQTAPRQPRAVEILELELLDGDGADYLFRVRCSKGTYVRTLCADIGAALGCGGCMSSLRRSRAGLFSLAQAVTLENLLIAAEHGQAEALLRPVDLLFSDRPALHIAGKAESKCRNGAVFSCDVPNGEYRFYAQSGEFLMLGRCENGRAYTIKSFFEVNGT